jgi:hypothetical protein
LKALERLKLSGTEIDPVLDSSVTLSQIFSAFPPRLLAVNARQIRFPDFDPFLFHESPALPPLGVPRLECLVPKIEDKTTQGDHAPVTVWKDVSGEKERWCYHVEDLAKTWEEVDKM